MSNTLIINIGKLVNVREQYSLLKGEALAVLPVMENAWLRITGGRITTWGSMQQYEVAPGEEVIDAKGGAVLPGWCDSHTHIVFAATREDEFVDKIKGLSYAEIAAKGGGILNSARKLRLATEEQLFNSAWKRLDKLIKQGTAAIEIKSGYGLSVADEVKMLRVIRRLKQQSPIPVKATFLGAHAVPEEYRGNTEGYIELIIQEMLPAIAAEQLADYIDVFCENGFFSAEQTIRVCEAGIKHGLLPKIHANQLSLSGGVQAGVQLGAVSVDHLETMDEAAIQALAGSNTIGTLLPSAAFFLRMAFQPARQLISAGCAVALASDYNPGSSPSGNMNLVVAMSCIQMKMLPEEALNAATINGAYAMQLEQEVGSITPGKLANLIITQPIPSLAYLPYSFGDNLIEKVIVRGEVWV